MVPQVILFYVGNCSFVKILPKLERSMYQPTDGSTEGWTRCPIDMRGRIEKGELEICKKTRWRNRIKEKNKMERLRRGRNEIEKIAFCNS